MIQRSTFPKVLLLLAAFVFFSANTVYMLDARGGDLLPDINKRCQFDFDKVQQGPYLNLKSALLVNYDNGEVIYAKNADMRRPIASITKLVTAMVLLDKNVDMKATAVIAGEDARRSSRSRLRVGYELTLEDLLVAALMNSDNRAARALAKAVSGSIEAFAAEMNRKVKSLGLKNTYFVEPTGLDSRNVSTAHEVAKILHYAYRYPKIASITASRKQRVKVQNRQNTYLQMANTNLLVVSRYDVLTGKTGFIRAADYCLASLVENDSGQRLTAVVLGVPGDKLRFRMMRKLLDWGSRQLSIQPTS